MKTSHIMIVLALSCFGTFSAQNDTINRFDDFNCKYGYWKVFNDLINQQTPVEEGYYLNGRKMGIWTEYYRDGSIKNRLEFSAGRPTGPCVLFYGTGDTLEYGTRINNRWTGPYVFYYVGNHRQHVFFYNDQGKKDGCQLYYNEAGHIVLEADFVNGKEISARASYADGTVKEEYKKLIRKKYDEKGNLVSKTVYEDEDKNNYVETVYYRTGKVLSVTPYIDRKRNGLVSMYYDNGNRKLQGAYVNDRLSGKRIYYNRSGKKINGEFVIYIEGQKNAERSGRCINGKPEGELKVYNAKGDVTMLINFKDGLPDGEMYHYVNNALRLTEVYSKGVFVTEISNKVSTNN
ncbi:MAG: hypothetical protein V4580_12355 [Bacteroidota bacterium]